MNERKDIDRLAREGTNQPPPFTYKEEHWQKAAAMLDNAATTSSGGARRIGWLILALVGIVVAGVTYWVTQNTKGQITARSGQQQVLAMSVPNITALGHANSVQTGIDLDNRPSRARNQDQLTGPEEPNKGIAATSNILGDDEENGVSRSYTVNAQSQATSNEQSGTEREVIGTTISETGERTLSSPEAEIALVSQQETEESRVRSSANMPATDLSNPDVEKEDRSDSKGVVQETLTSETSEAESKVNTGSASIQIVQAEMPALSWFTLDRVLGGGIEKDQVELPSLYREIDMQEQLKKWHEGSKWKAWIDLAARLTQSWGEKKVNASPYLGIGLNYQFSPRVSLGSGIYAYMRTNESLVKTESVRHYSFGVNTASYGQQLNRVYYAGLPLTLGYLIHPRHQIGFGAHLNYVLSTYSSALTAWPDNIELNPEAVAGYNYLDGMERLDLGLHLNYRFLVNDLWSVWMRFDYALRPAIISDYYDHGVSGRNHGLSIGFRHELK